VTSVDGKLGKQCRKVDLQCDCDGRAIKLGLKTTCSSANAVGKCGGSRACGVGGLSACSAPAAVSETCNELDDDCDGKTDEADPGVCDDGSACTYDNCVNGNCQHPPATGDCDDASACSTGDTCVNGKCVGDKVTCDDGNPCTADSCDPKVGCQAKPQDGPACDDGSVCTVGDSCKGGLCLPGATTACDDGNSCTTDGCDPKSGCIAKPNQVACNDGSVCTVGDTCADGKCAGGKAVTCNDGNPCTDDGCDPQTGCTIAANTAPCSDGNPCTVGEACQGGVCAFGGVLGCDDGNPCTTDACDPKKGCVAVANSQPCSDGNGCTVGDTCAEGKCAPGLAKDCEDGNPCTVNLCDAVKGCVAVSSADPCSDNNVCTEGDSCQGGKCVGGAFKSCTDGEPCTDDACHPQLGCQYLANKAACSDGNACTEGDACAGGSCVGGGAVTCDDGNPCTTDACDAKKGCVAKANAAPCTDGNVCTQNDLCNAGACEPGSPVACDDNNPCTSDLCNPKSGCQASANTAPCTDGDVCTVADTCNAGACKPGAPLPCDDGNPCTDDSCDPAKGCVAKANAAGCDDGNACTAGDACKSGKCLAALAKCDDGNPCTDDGCDPAKGCVASPNSAPCSDGSVCTGNDTCAAGVCKPGAALACNDGNPCTDDSCDPAKGCSYAANKAACDDGNGCTAGDSCSAGMCKGGAACAKEAQCQGGLACVCNSGYTGNGFSCADVDECANGSAQCADNSVCTNTPGSFSCGCKNGFSDCNAQASDGCEVNSWSSVQNCGGCKLACSTQNIANPTCLLGVCSGTCAPGTYDCNANKQLDGCEFVATAPAEGAHVIDASSVQWKWGAVAGATGYRYNTVNDYPNATKTANTTFTQANLAGSTKYQLYVWADYGCGASLATTLNATTNSAGYVLQPVCSCANMVLVQATKQHAIGGNDVNSAWNNLHSICQVYGFRGPTTSAGATGLWAKSNNPGFPITSDAWNPTGPWMSGKLVNGFPGGRIWIASGEPSWLSRAVYPAIAKDLSLFTNQGAITWESYHPQTGGNWNQISSGTVQVGDYVMCAE
jgi:hypothetical protein